MATTKIWAVHSRLDHLVDYVANKDKTANLFFDDLHNVLEYSGDEAKTERKYFVSGLNCQPETAYPAMRQALALNHKPLKILGFHGYQSFAEHEITAEVAHEIGMKLAQELWGEKFQMIVATHCNTAHFHNHFVVCSTSFLDGSRYPASKATYRKMREVSDRLCREYGLSVIEHPQSGKTKHYAEWQADKLDKPTWRGIIRSDIDRAIAQSATDKQFFFRLREMGYQVKTGKDISVRPPGKERFFRLKRNLGEDYSLEAICHRILEQQSQTTTKENRSPPLERTAQTKAHRRLAWAVSPLLLSPWHLPEEAPPLTGTATFSSAGGLRQIRQHHIRSKAAHPVPHRHGGATFDISGANPNGTDRAYEPKDSAQENPTHRR